MNLTRKQAKMVMRHSVFAVEYYIWENCIDENGQEYQNILQVFYLN
jgi:hypothetical protein